MVKKLIIHIGYPKTATTTIQDGLFVNLHNQGIINYYGKSEYNNNDKFNYARNICNDMFLDDEFRDKGIILSSDVVNVISEELLTLPSIFREIQWRRKVANSFNFHQRLQKHFMDKADQIIIMVTLRKQQEAIYSLLVEQYPRLIKNEDYIGYKAQKIMFNNNQFNSDLFTIFYYNRVLQQYACSFGKDNVKMFFFEDYQYNKNLFIQELSKIIGVNSTTVEGLLKSVHYREKKMSGHAYYKKVRKKTPASHSLQLVLKNNFMKGLLMKTYAIRKKYYTVNNYFAEIVKKLQRKKSTRTYMIPKLTEAQKSVIFNEFREDNMGLVNEFNINEEKLRKYGYI